MKRNPSQLRAIAHLSGPMMVLAGPGSGKTSVIVERTAYMINEGKIPASSILVVTFSRAAATEMKERFLKFVGQNRSEVTFGTFHGIFYGILKAAYHLSAANILSEEEKDGYSVTPSTADGKTETVKVIYDFPYEDGWTNCFAGERASGLTAMPSSGAIYGSKVDTITETGIRRDEYGDYCCAMGVWYGYCGDRFLIELENGTQFTTKICDSKGYADDGEGKYHNFGGSGKCIVEFIYDDYNLPSCVAFSGSWGFYNWNGLDLGANIKSIKKINYGEPVEY